MTITNRIENGIIAATAMILTVLIFGLYNHFFVLKPLQNELKAQREAIVRLAEIPKYSIDNDFGKMKTRDGKVILDLNNKMDNQEENLPIQSRADSFLLKKSIWERLFYHE
jgi:flagellar motor component MotA